MGRVLMQRQRSVLKCYFTLLVCGVLAGMQIVEADESRLVQTSGYGVDGLVFWLAADSGVTKDANGHVTELIDKTKNFTLTANASDQKPTYVPNGLSGKPVLRFNGRQSLYSSDNFGTALNRDMTIIVVTMTTAIPDYQESALALGQHDVHGNNRGYEYYAGREWFDGHFVGSPGEPMVSNTFLMSAVSIDPSLSQLTFYRNGKQTLTTGIEYGTFGKLSPGVTVGADPQLVCGWQGDIAEELVYDRQLTDAEVQSIWQQLSDKYDLPQAIAPQAPQPAPPDDLGRPLVIKEPCGFGDPLPLIIAFGVGIVVVGGICFYLIFDRLNKIASLLAQGQPKRPTSNDGGRIQGPPSA